MNPWKSVTGLPRDVWVLFFVTTVNRAGTMVMPFLALYIADELGFGPRTAGNVLMAYGAAALAMGVLAGRAADRFGALHMMRLSLLGSGVVLFFFPFARSLPSLIAVTSAWCVFAELLRPASLALAADIVPPEQRKQSFAVSRLAVNLGMSIGPVAGGFLAEISYSFLFYVDGLTSIAAAALLFVLPIQARWAAVRDPARPPPPVIPWWKVDRRLAFLLVASIPVGLVFFQILAAHPLYLKRDLHITESTMGLVFAVNTVLIVLTEIPLNAAMSHWTHRNSLIAGALFVGAGFGATALAFGPWTAALTVAIWTVGEMIVFPSMSAYISDIAPPERRGHYMGLYTMTFSLAFAVGPWAGTRVLASAGGTALWIGCAALSLVSVAMFRGLEAHRNP